MVTGRLAADSRCERVLMVSPYPPLRDGIGAYALQEVRELRHRGNDVEVVSPYPSAAHHHLDLIGPRGASALARLMRGFDRVIVQFHPDVFYRAPATPGSRISEGLALGLAMRSGPPVEIRLHEVDHRWADRSDPSARATTFLFRSAERITVHVPEHRTQMVDRFGVAPDRVVLTDHGAHFMVRIPNDQAAARGALGLPADAHMFLCIGFVQPHKGFDRAVHAFRGLAERGAALHIVGSVRIDDPAADDHVRELRNLARQVPGVDLHLSFVSDEAFDRWIVAADTVVLPYRHIWSSSVAERAALYGRSIIATRVGGLADQLADTPGVTLVDDNAGLAAALREAVQDESWRSAAPARSSGTWSFDGPVDRRAVLEEIRRRAAATRGAPLLAGRGTGHLGGEATVAPSAPLRRLRPLMTPAPVSARPGVSVLKKLIRRAIAWELDPLRDQLGRLQRAAVESVDAETALLVSTSGQHVPAGDRHPEHDRQPAPTDGGAGS